MGIRGLTGFIDKNQGLLHQHELHDCSVVVDGNNFYHYLYYACHVQCSFGGDYDVYRKNVVSTFQGIKECGITPYVVLDGAYTVDGRKLKTSLSRAVNRIRLVDSITNGHAGQALPVLAYETFVQVMLELGIPHTMCQFEADSEIATLANQLQCPVISNDSDFYIFDLEFGFLPLDYIDFRPKRKQNAGEGTKHCYLHCYKYHVDNLISSFDLKRSTLPIFATLMGNDFVDASDFSAFYSRFKVPKIVSKKFSLPPKMTKVISVLHWLHTLADDSSITNIRDQLLDYIPTHKRSFVQKLFDKAVLGYTEVNTFEGCDLFGFFSDSSFSSFNESCDFHSYNGKQFPKWFVQAVCKGELTSHILNATILHRVILLTQMESLSLTSSYNASSFLRNALYAMLLNDDNNHNADAKYGEHAMSVCECENTSKEHATVPQADCQGEPKIKTDLEQQNVELEEAKQSADQGDENNAEKDESEEDLSEEDVVLEEEKDSCVVGNLRYKSAVVEEYTRVNKQLKKNVVNISCEFVEKLGLPGLEEISSLASTQREGVLFKVFDADPSSLKPIPDKLKIFCLSLISWIRFCDPRVTFSQLDSLLLSIIFLAARRELKARKRKHVSFEKKDNSSKQCHISKYEMVDSGQTHSLDIDFVCCQCETSHLKTLTAALDKHHTDVPSFNRSNTFNTNICHGFAQLQAILVDGCHLNRLLQQPLPNPRPAELINGTLLYNLSVDISARPNPELFVSLMFSEKDSGSPLQVLYKSLRHFLLEELKLDNFLDLPVQHRGKNKRKKNKNREKQTVQCKEAESDKDEQAEAAGVQKDDEFSEFAANNKFSLLMLCD